MFEIDNTYAKKLNLIKAHFSALGTMDWGKAIADYYETHPAQRITNVEELPRLALPQIRQLLEKEKEYDENAKLFQARVSQGRLDGETAQLAGFLPGAETPLFPWLFHGFTARSTAIEDYKLGMDALNDLFTDQFAADFPVVERAIIQPHRPYYYRGERKFYGQSKPTIYREGHATLNDLVLVKYLKIEEASTMLDTIPPILEWNRAGRVNYVGLCQHYGLDTIMLDLTSDLMTALFFACCKWVNGAWEPITAEDLEKDPDGILHIASKEIFDIELATDAANSMFVVPIGHQPLLRCSAQRGYMGLAANKGDIIDLYTDRHFTTYRFERDEAFCKWVFEKCGRGNAIYPRKDSPLLNAYFARLKTSPEIPADIVENCGMDLQAVREAVERAGYRICESGERLLSAEEKSEISRQVRKIVDERDLVPLMRPLYSSEDIFEAIRTGTLPDSYKG